MSGLPCARCGAPVRGAACDACGAPRLIAKSADDTAPSCTRHPERIANGSCARCGAFGCGTCLVVDDGVLRCRSCRPSRLVAPWAHVGRASPRAFLSTAWSACVRPSQLAEELRASSTGNGLGFALVAGSVGAAVSGLSARVLQGERDLTTLFVVTFVGLLAGWIVGLTLLDWLVLRLLGVPATLRRSLQAASYALAPLTFALVPCACVPLALVWSVALRVVLLRRLHGLSWPEVLLTTGTAPLVTLTAAIALRWDVLFR